jgi:hypothetical protein
MAENDRAIWERFIAAHPRAFTEVDYDVAVGSTPDYAQSAVVQGGGNMERLYKRKIDAVGYAPGIDTVVEVKPQCTMSTIGQVTGYMHLYTRDMQPTNTVTGMIVCERADPDAIEFAEMNKILVMVV